MSHQVGISDSGRFATPDTSSLLVNSSVNDGVATLVRNGGNKLLDILEKKYHKRILNLAGILEKIGEAPISPEFQEHLRSLTERLEEEIETLPAETKAIKKPLQMMMLEIRLWLENLLAPQSSPALLPE